jgi:hypothetical protein
MSELVLYLYRHILGPYKFKFISPKEAVIFGLAHKIKVSERKTVLTIENTMLEAKDDS